MDRVRCTGRLLLGTMIAAVGAIVGVGTVAASDVDTGAGPTSVTVTFDCAPDQTPNLIVPIRDHDELFPAGTTTTEYDFGTVEFIDTPLMIDCTPYDDADVECFVVLPPADQDILVAEPAPLGEYCILPDPRPIGGTTTTTTAATTAPTTTGPPAVVTNPAELAATGPRALPAIVATLSVAVGLVLIGLARRSPTAGRRAT